ncbi:MAG: ammonia-forming cytochrome c nitrite reductase subunit c552 [Lachnospiraceae bacterium]|nr:ammonia-forming cytochrome c nitrite reductase subunit c552 [Lachnospiraceae bacterium]
MKTTWMKGIAAAAIAGLSFLALGGLPGGRGDVVYRLADRSKIAPLTREDISYKEVPAPEATSRDGTVSAKDWEAEYPYITASMNANEENSYVTDYLEQDPYLVNIYEGYGFAKDYGSARGHNYDLEDVHNTERPHATANCLTCKTPNFTKLVNDIGTDAYSMDFEEVYAQMEEATSCYNCHGNEAGNRGELVVTHSYVNKALGDQMNAIDPAVLSCGQCHIEYYFQPDTKETTMPYSGVETMTPAAIYEYYESIGFSDWTQESTGAQMLKAQHPEMETFLQGKHAALLNCADCHMPIDVADDGTIYHSHKWVSPLENQDLLALCATCHGDTDMTEMVHNIQGRITARETEVGNKLSGLKDALAEANAAGTMPEAELDRVRALYREAQWYFDYCYVENSEGAHNSDLSMECLDTSAEKISEAMELLV